MGTCLFTAPALVHVQMLNQARSGCHTSQQCAGLTGLLLQLQLVEGAEAKACWGLKTNWQALQAVTELLMFKGTITGVHG